MSWHPAMFTPEICMYIYLVISEHPVDGESIIYAFRSKERAYAAARLLGEVAVLATTYRVDGIMVEM